MLTRGRRGRAPSPAQIAQLIDALNASVADYRDRRQRHAAADPARLFADGVSQHLDQLIALIERRAATFAPRTARGWTAIPLMAPHAVFTAHVVTWLPPLRAWRDRAAAERAQHRRRRGRPHDAARWMLACAVAAALDQAGIRPTTAKTGMFARVLREIVYPAIAITDRDTEHAVRMALDALDHWRTLPEWQRRLPRRTTSAKTPPKNL
jgi:hypothetical protein